MLFSDRLFIRKIFLLAGDLGLMFFSLFLALSVRGLWVVSFNYYLVNLKVFLPIFFVSSVVYVLFDLYGLRMLQKIYRLVYYLFMATIANLVLATVYLYIFQARSEISPKTVLVLYILLVFFLTVVWRFLYNDLFFTSRKYLKKTIIVSDGKIDSELMKLSNPPAGVDFEITGLVSVDDDFKNSSFENVPHLGDFKDIQKIIVENKIEEIILAADSRKDDQEFIKTLSDSLMLGIKIFEWPVFYEHVFQKIPIDKLDHFWFIYTFGENDKRIFEHFKRVFDLLISVVGMIFFFLIFPLVALLIKLTSPGPIFYCQRRLGKDGKIFTLIKFRTMENNAEKEGAVWSSSKDKRITSVGKILRRSRIDEVPQFLNILKGEMSLVGPRPERPEFLSVLSEKIPFYYKRQMVKPGVTGFAQVMYPYAETVEDSLEKVGYDLFYIKNRSFYLYFKIILLTLRTMLTLSGR